MYFIRPTRIEKALFPHALWVVKGCEKKIFLTFDDGPVPEVTLWALEQLKIRQAHATFFCVGQNIERHPEIFRKIISEGHGVGNHTYNHLNGWKTPVKNYMQNISRCDNAMRTTASRTLPVNSHPFGTANLYFRPPYGKLTFSQYAIIHKKYSIVMWDVLSGDFLPNLSAEKCLRNVLQKTRNGSIVVFHDSIKASKKLLYVLPKFLEHFSGLGYTFSKLKGLN